MAETTTPAEFFGTPVRIIDHAGLRWLTAEEAGRCLGYNDANAGAGIRNLYNRHLDEFTESDATRINLMRVHGKPAEFLIFSATGCTKLGFFASTPRAKEFRAWAAKVLAGQPATVTPAVPPGPTFPPARALPSARIVTRRLERLAMELFVAGNDIAETGRQLGLSRTTTSLILHGKYQFGLLAGEPEAGHELIAAVAARHLAVEQARLAEQQQRVANRYLSSANNAELARALEEVGRQLQRRPAAALAAPKAES